jgi:hypothetical protein
VTADEFRKEWAFAVDFRRLDAAMMMRDFDAAMAAARADGVAEERARILTAATEHFEAVERVTDELSVMQVLEDVRSICAAAALHRKGPAQDEGAV